MILPLLLSSCNKADLPLVKQIGIKPLSKHSLSCDHGCFADVFPSFEYSFYSILLLVSVTKVCSENSYSSNFQLTCCFVMCNLGAGNFGTDLESWNRTILFIEKNLSYPMPPSIIEDTIRHNIADIIYK